MLACSSSENAPIPVTPPTIDDAGSDGPARTPLPDAGPDAPPTPDAGNPPTDAPPSTPYQALDIGGLRILGMTSSGFIPYIDPATHQSAAVSKTGVRTYPIVADVPSDPTFRVDGDAVLFWYAKSVPGHAQPIVVGGVWSLNQPGSIHGSPAYEMTPLAPGYAAVSRDGKTALFGARGVGDFHDFYVAEWVEKPAFMLDPQTAYGPAVACLHAPIVVGYSFVTIGCTDQKKPSAVTRWEPEANGTLFRQELLADAALIAGSSVKGGTVLAVRGDAKSALVTIPILGGAPVPIEDGVSSFDDGVARGVAVTPDGATVVFRSVTGTMRRSSIASPATHTIPGVTADGVVAFSPDGASFVYENNGALGVASLTNGDGHAFANVAGTTLKVAADPFTHDGAFALTLRTAGATTALEATPIAGGASVILAADVVDARAAKSKVVFLDAMTHELRAVDPHAPEKATVIASNVTSFALDAERAGVAYATDYGIYFAAVP